MCQEASWWPSVEGDHAGASDCANRDSIPPAERSPPVRFRILSDLHLECGPFTYTPAGEDVVVLAGDIADQSRAGIRHRRLLCEAIAATGIPAVHIGGYWFGFDPGPN